HPAAHTEKLLGLGWQVDDLVVDAGPAADRTEAIPAGLALHAHQHVLGDLQSEVLGGHPRRPELANQRHLRRAALEVWTAIEGIDPLDVAEAGALQHPLHALGLWSDLAHDPLDPLGEQGHEDVRGGEQLLDELLVLPAELVRLRVGEAGELLADALPE